MPAGPTTITIKNDLSSDINGSKGMIKIVFDGGSKVTTTIQRNHTLEISCKDVKAIYAGIEQNTNRGKFLFKTEGNCGKTINLSSVW